MAAASRLSSEARRTVSKVEMGIVLEFRVVVVVVVGGGGGFWFFFWGLS